LRFEIARKLRLSSVIAMVLMSSAEKLNGLRPTKRIKYQ
jgi:hypothetical protein